MGPGGRHGLEGMYKDNAFRYQMPPAGEDCESPMYRITDPASGRVFGANALVDASIQLDCPWHQDCDCVAEASISFGHDVDTLWDDANDSEEAQAIMRGQIFEISQHFMDGFVDLLRFSGRHARGNRIVASFRASVNYIGTVQLVVIVAEDRVIYAEVDAPALGGFTALDPRDGPWCVLNL